MRLNSRQEEEALVHRTVLTVKRLMASGYDGWVPWRRVAKEQEGSEEFDVVLSGLATKEPWKQYFHSGMKGVKLSEEGLRLAGTIHVPTASDIQAVAASVKEYAARLRRVRLDVHSVSKVAKVESRYVQAFEVDASDEAVASETPCEFRCEATKSITRGRVIGQEPDGGVLYVAMDAEVYPSSLPGYLSIDRAFLLRALADRLEAFKGMPKRMAPVLRRGDATAELVTGNDSLEVADRLAALPAPWTRFLWGPPGAGKTYGMGHLVTRLLCKEPNSRTLIVAPSNRAVDVAVEQFLRHLEKSERRELIAQRGILRFGYPRKPSIFDRTEVLGSPELDALNREVKRIADRIQRAERERGSQQDIAILRTQMLAAQEEVKKAMAAHIGRCRVVATTVTLAYLPSSPIAACVWDNVIVDEVTMVPSAMCTFLASLATRRFLLAGDPRQLGPVYESFGGAVHADFEWMGRDIFDKSGLSKGEGMERQVVVNDSRLARIQSQRRCAAPIWKRVAKLYPGVKHGAEDARMGGLFALPPCWDEAFVLLDTSKAQAVARCEKRHHSWENPFTAELALEVVCAIAAETARPISVAIVAPYRAQVRLLRKWLRQEQRAVQSPLNGIEVDAGTVHQFQGSDADVIVFDMVDGPGRERIGNLLRGDTGLRLVNVAFTRAKGKLVLIADREWCTGALTSQDNALLRQLIVRDEDLARLEALPPGEPGNASSPAGTLAEQILLEAVRARPELPEAAPGYVLHDAEGVTVAVADIAFPSLKFAVYVDGWRWNYMAGAWQCERRQRHRLVDAGWSFAVFSIAEVHQDPDSCAVEIVRLLRAHIGDGRAVTGSSPHAARQKV